MSNVNKTANKSEKAMSLGAFFLTLFYFLEPSSLSTRTFMETADKLDRIANKNKAAARNESVWAKGSILPMPADVKVSDADLAAEAKYLSALASRPSVWAKGSILPMPADVKVTDADLEAEAKYVSALSSRPSVWAKGSILPMSADVKVSDEDLAAEAKYVAALESRSSVWAKGSILPMAADVKVSDEDLAAEAKYCAALESRSSVWAKGSILPMSAADVKITDEDLAAESKYVKAVASTNLKMSNIWSKIALSSISPISVAFAYDVGQEQLNKMSEQEVAAMHEELAKADEKAAKPSFLSAVWSKIAFSSISPISTAFAYDVGQKQLTVTPGL